MQRDEMRGGFLTYATPFSRTFDATPKILSAIPDFEAPNLVECWISGWFSSSLGIIYEVMTT